MTETELQAWTEEFKAEYHAKNWGTTEPIIDNLLARIECLESQCKSYKEANDYLISWVGVTKQIE